MPLMPPDRLASDRLSVSGGVSDLGTLSFSANRCEPLLCEVKAPLVAFAPGSEFACDTGTLDQAAPPLVPTILPCDLAPAWQRTVAHPVGQRPQPRLPPKITARTALTAGYLAVSARPRRMPTHLRAPGRSVVSIQTRDLLHGLSWLRLALSCRNTADLAHQHLVGANERERRPRGDHSPDWRRLGDRYVGR
jgi:hypothetical protein